MCCRVLLQRTCSSLSSGLTAGRIVLRSKFHQGSVMSGPKDPVLGSARWVPAGQGWLLLDTLPPQAWLQDEPQPSLICSGFDGLNLWLFGQLKVKSVKRVIPLDCEPESTHDAASARLSDGQVTTHLVELAPSCCLEINIYYFIIFYTRGPRGRCRC